MQFFDLKIIYIKRSIYTPHVVSKVSLKKTVMSIDGHRKDNARSSLRPEVYLNILFLLQRKSTATPGLEPLGLRPFREIICENPTIHIHTVCGQNAGLLTFKRRIKSHRPFAGIIRSSPYSTSFQDKS